MNKKFNVDVNGDEFINAVTEKVNATLETKNAELEDLRSQVAQLATSSFSGGIPNVAWNRGDLGSAFRFPYEWAFTCKRMGNSQWLKPITNVYKAVYQTFKFDVVSDNQDVVDYINWMHKDEFARVTANLFAYTLQYGFYFWIPEYEYIAPEKFNMLGMGAIKVPRLPKGKDPTGTQAFIFDEAEIDTLSSIRFLSQPKAAEKNNDLYIADTINQGSSATIQYIDLNIKQLNIGWATCNYQSGDPLGVPLFYSVYGTWKVLDEMDQSFGKSLSKFGEHSYMLKPHNNTEPMTDKMINEARINAKKTFIDGGGGIYADKYMYIAKLDSFNAKDWAEFRETMVAELWKSLGVDSKALGMTKGSTRNLAEVMQADTLNQVKNFADEFIQFYNEYLNRIIRQYWLDASVDIKITFEKAENTEIKEENAEFSSVEHDVIEMMLTPICSKALELTKLSISDNKIPKVLNEVKDVVEIKRVVDDMIRYYYDNTFKPEIERACNMTSKPVKDIDKLIDKLYNRFIRSKEYKSLFNLYLNNLRSDILNVASNNVMWDSDNYQFIVSYTQFDRLIIEASIHNILELIKINDQIIGLTPDGRHVKEEYEMENNLIVPVSIHTI